MELNGLYKGIIVENGDDYKYLICPVEENKGVFTCWLMPELPGKFKKSKLRESEITFTEYPPTASEYLKFSEELKKKGIEFVKNEICTETVKQKEITKHQKAEKILELIPIPNVPKKAQNADYIYFNGTQIIFHAGAALKLGLSPALKVSFFIHKEEEIKNIYLKITKDGRFVLKKRNDLIVNSSSISSFVVQLFGEKSRFSVGEKRKSNFGEVFILSKIEQK